MCNFGLLCAEDPLLDPFWIGGPAGISGQRDLTIDMQITEEEYSQMGRPGINETVQLEFKKVQEEYQV